jgi:hypothetical protein
VVNVSSVSSLGKYGEEGQAMVAVLLALAAAVSFGGSDYTHERLTKAGLFGLCLAAATVSLIAAGAVS